MRLLEKAKLYLNGEEILRGWVGSGGVVVSQELADSRSRICLKCEMNDIGFSPAEAVASTILKLVAFKNKMNLRTPGEKRLGTCSACLCPIKTKIWLPLKNISPSEEERGKFWDQCWLLNEKE